jgi:hypothetical protein
MINLNKDQGERVKILAPQMYRLLLLLQQEWMKGKVKLSPAMGVTITKLLDQVNQ